MYRDTSDVTSPCPINGLLKGHPKRRGIEVRLGENHEPPENQPRHFDISYFMKRSKKSRPPSYGVGFHYDLHATKEDTVLGLNCAPSELVPMLRRMKPDLVQTDCKGHPGYTSWFSKTPDASVPPGLKKDALDQWRAATRQLGLPLFCHYSGIWDAGATEKHPEWRVVPSSTAKSALGQNAGGMLSQTVCPRSGYLHELMIPQFLELIDRYDVDGIWIDGDIWAVEPCYCPKCIGAFRDQTGSARPPEKTSDPEWPAWWNFTRESFDAYVTAYCDAVHRHKPGVRVCSNWLQTFTCPGEPSVPTDWISGDNSFVYGLDISRCEARFISTRGKHWDIMLWSFYQLPKYFSEPPVRSCFKSFDMLAQEAAVPLSFGGAVQFYEHPHGLRDGRLVGWHQDRLGELVHFVRKRLPVCRGTVPHPQVAVLHSEHHFRATVVTSKLRWGVDTASVEGAVYSLLENHFGVDVLDEWALASRLAEFPCIVVPEQHALSDGMVVALKRYVEEGGCLLVSGVECGARWPDRFLGVTGKKTASNATYCIPAGRESVPVWSSQWRFPRLAGADAFGELSTSDARPETNIGFPAATLHRVGLGKVAFVPFAIFREYKSNRYQPTRRFLGELMAALDFAGAIQAEAPLSVDIAYRQKGDTLQAHFVNRASGIPNQPDNGAIDQIPHVGPIRLRWKMPRPASVELVFETEKLKWKWQQGVLTVLVPRIRIHAAVLIKRKSPRP